MRLKFKTNGILESKYLQKQLFHFGNYLRLANVVNLAECPNAIEK